jgi:hypothetical protein
VAEYLAAIEAEAEAQAEMDRDNGAGDAYEVLRLAGERADDRLAS